MSAMNDGTPRVRHVPDTAEGDVNLSPLRRAWERDHVRGSTRALLDRDADAYLHQSLSTPCFDALVEAEGIWLTDVDGRRFMDFHGNNVHQVGYRHPRVIDAIKRQALPDTDVAVGGIGVSWEVDLSGRLRAGVVWCNTFNQFDAASPFGGYRESGFGREGGMHGLRPYVKV